jgi:hypothetical protein
VNDTEKKPFVVRMREVLGTGKNASEFMAELKALSPEDRVWYANELNKAGYPTLEPGLKA